MKQPVKPLLAIPVFAAMAAMTIFAAGPQAGSEPVPPPRQSQMVMDHAPLDIPLGKPVPKMALYLVRDSKSGLNLHIELRDFQIGPPELALDDSTVGGHAHLYVNGKKVQRIYGRYLHLPEELFRPGVNLIMVSLNTHDHRVWQWGGKQVLASSFVNLEADSLVLHSFSSSPLK